MSYYQDWIVKHAYFKSKDAPLKDCWVRLRGVARQKGLSVKALEKLGMDYFLSNRWQEKC